MYRNRRKRSKFPLLCLLIILLFAAWFFTREDKSRFTELKPNQETPLDTPIPSAVESETITESIPFSEIEISDDEVSGGYYYQQLTKEEQDLYREIYQGIRNSDEKIYVHSADTDAMEKAVHFLFYDRAEIFWGSGAMQMTSLAGYSEIRPVYTYSHEERTRRQTEIDAAAQEALSGISPEASEYEKIKYVFEYLVNTVDYSMESQDNQNIYSALVEKSSACAGYSRAAQYLLQQLGIECIYVTGVIADQGPHAWNIVKCDGQYYQMDVTFGDPVFQETESGAEQPPTNINYDYLCCSDEEILRNHIPDTFVAYPQCPSSELNYYKLNGMYYETYDPDQILEAMNQSVYAQEISFTCKFASADLYTQACDDILTRLVPEAVQNLLMYYGLESARYTYSRDDVMNKLTIFWGY